MEPKGLVFEIQRFCLHDGPGIRTTVFLKGCPLRCTWCANPESQSLNRELFYTGRDCMRCGSCIEACHRKAVKIIKNKIILDRVKCDCCTACVDACPKSLFQIKGKTMTCKDVVEAVVRDRPFFEASAGGMTISGGEPVVQKDFIRYLLKMVKVLGITTCIETSLYGPFDAFKTLLPLLDHILFDVKHWDSDRHLRSTGKDNRLITENIRSLMRVRPDAIARIPVIPRFNDGEEDVKKMIFYLKRAGVGRVELLPYHNLAKSKYPALGRKYEYSTIVPLDEAALQRIRMAYQTAGLDML